MKPVAALRHVPQLVQSRHVAHRVHGSGPIGRFNARTALLLTKSLSSMWFFWFCVALDLLELPAVIAVGSVIAWITYISQTVIQLLALPALGAGQALMQAASDARAETDHQTLTALHEINKHQVEILERLDAKA